MGSDAMITDVASLSDAPNTLFSRLHFLYLSGEFPSHAIWRQWRFAVRDVLATRGEMRAYFRGANGAEGSFAEKRIAT